MSQTTNKTMRTQKKPNFSNVKRRVPESTLPQPQSQTQKNIRQSTSKGSLNATSRAPGQTYHRIQYSPKPIQSRAPKLGDRTSLKPKSNLTTFKFTQAELEKLRAGFNEIDLDGNGRLDKYEMNTFLTKNGLDIAFTDLAYELFSHDGQTLDFQEFQKYISITSQMDDNPRVFYKCLFDYIDKDHSGGIDENELMEFCRLVKSPITKAESRRAIRDLDDRHTGTIHFEELCKYLGV